MKFKLRWLPLGALTVVVLVCGLSNLVLGQGPVLTALPTPTPAPFTPDAAASPNQITPASLPDLVVTGIKTEPAVPKVGQPTKILVTVKNNGATGLNSGNNFLTDLYIDPPNPLVVDYHQLITPDLPWGLQWFWLPAGGSYDLSTTWVFTDVKTFEIAAQVDSGGDVIEGNEDNNTKKVNVSVVTKQNFTHDTHEDFLTNMASTLDNSDPTGLLRLGRFVEPPFFERPFTNETCQITPTNMAVSDHNMENPDSSINGVTTGTQVEPKIIANGSGVVIAVWEDGRNGDIADRDIFLRYSTDSGATWGAEERVNDDPLNNSVNQLNPVAAISDDGTLMVAWQDRRDGNYEIYAQRFLLSGSTLSRSGSNIRVDSADPIEEQINPDIAVDEAGGFHVAWQDKRNGHYDIFATSHISGTWTLVRRIHDDLGITQQVNPTLEVLDSLEVTGVDYSVAPTEPYTVTVNEVISQPARILIVTWEDDRNGSTDIAMVASSDGGETFDIDALITNDPADGDQSKPDVTLTNETTLIDFKVPVPGGETTVEIEVPVSEIHTAWEGYTTPDELDRDIFYSQSRLGPIQVGSSNDFRFELSVGGSEKINQKDLRDWQTAPVDQRDPAVTAIPCTGGDDEGWNLFITWADGRNYDSANYDIYYTLKSTCGASVGDNQMLNDGVRLHNFDAANVSYGDYNPGHPPPGYQVNPSVAADIQLAGSTVSGGYLYLAWEDDRAGDPQHEKDLYFARSNLTFFNQNPYTSFNDGAGSYISNILDAGSADTTWYTLGWSATTPASTYVTVQTRLGNTMEEVLSGDWYPKLFPFQPQLGACDNLFNDTFTSGAPLPGHGAPGQHIEDAAGNFWPEARYIQYRVNFYTRDETKTPELDNLTIYYDSGVISGAQIYLPIVVK